MLMISAAVDPDNEDNSVFKPAHWGLDVVVEQDGLSCSKFFTTGIKAGSYEFFLIEDEGVDVDSWRDRARSFIVTFSEDVERVKWLRRGSERYYFAAVETTSAERA